MSGRLIAVALAGCLVLASGFASPVEATDDIAWVRRWDTPYSPHTVVAVGDDRVYSITLDEYPHYPISRLRSFDSNGRFLSWRRLPKVEVSDADADERGVFLVGTRRSDAIVLRVSKTRRVAWQRSLVGEVVIDCTVPCEGDECYCPMMEQASGIAVTRRAVYVTGEAETRFPGQRVAGDRDGFLAKFTKDGRRLWVVQFGTPRIDQPYDVVAGHHRIFVVGETWGDRRGVVHFVRAFRPDGSTAWERRRASRYFLDPVAALVGQRLVVGGAWHSHERDLQVIVSAYGLKGRVLWDRRLRGSRDNDVVLDAVTVGRTVVLAGSTSGSFQGADHGRDDDVLLLGMRGDGTTAWFRQIASPASAYASSVAAIGGDLVVGGWALGTFLEARGDAFVLRTSPG